MTQSTLTESTPQMAIHVPNARQASLLTDAALDLALRGSVEMVQRVIAAPIDRVMLLTAVEGELVRQGRLPRHGFRGIAGCFLRVWRKEGVRGLLRGVFADAVLTLPSLLVDAVAGYVVQITFARLLPASTSQHLTPVRIVLLTQGALFAMSWVASPYNGLRKTVMTNYIADIVAPIPTSPSPSVGKTPSSPLAEEAYRYTSAVDAARTIYYRHGWRGFFRGIAVDPMAVCLYRGLYLGAVMTLNKGFLAQHPQLPLRALALLANVITQPLEVVGRRLVLTASDSEARSYGGVVDCARKIVQEEGITALWSGLRFRLMLTGISIGAAIIYETIAQRRTA